MAVTCYSFPHILKQKTGPTLKPLSRVLMLKHKQVPAVRKAPTAQIRSSFQNKVFEDQSRGIICYRDDSGEIICEGYDEGPRIHQQSLRTTYNPRDIIDLLQQRWLQVYNGIELNNADKGVAVQEDFN